MRSGVRKGALPALQPGQLVLRLSDGAVLEVVTRGPRNRYRLSDGSWVTRYEVEDPLYDGRRRDLERAQLAELRHEAIARGDFEAVFPAVAAARRGGPPRNPAMGWAIAGWGLLGLETLAIVLLALGV